MNLLFAKMGLPGFAVCSVPQLGNCGHWVFAAGPEWHARAGRGREDRERGLAPAKWETTHSGTK